MQPKESRREKEKENGIDGDEFWPPPSQHLKERLCQAVFGELRINLILLVILLLATSLLSSVVTKRFSSRCVQSPSEQSSRYAGLLADEVKPFIDKESPFASTANDTATFALWQSIHTKLGNIAVPKSTSESWNIPSSMRFPWDHSKSIYQLSGIHSLHCVKSIAVTLYQLKYDLPLSRSWKHVMHCVESLRQDVMCQADDTPRYTIGGALGFDQTRQCRSWEKLEEWAKQYNSCYGGDSFNPQPLIEHYKYCPKGSPYRDQVSRVWGNDFIERFDRGEAE